MSIREKKIPVKSRSFWHRKIDNRTEICGERKTIFFDFSSKICTSSLVLNFMTVLIKERWLVWPEAFRDEEAITFAVNTKTSIKIQRWLPSLPPSAMGTSLNVVFFTWKTHRKYGTDHSCMVQWKQNLSCQLYFCVRFYGPSGLYLQWSY